MKGGGPSPIWGRRQLRLRGRAPLPKRVTDSDRGWPSNSVLRTLAAAACARNGVGGNAVHPGPRFSLMTGPRR